MEYLSYVASVMATGLGLCEPFRKNMKNILVFNFLANLLASVSYLLVKSFNGAAIGLIASVQGLINYSFTAQGKKVPRWLILIHWISFLSVNLLMFAHWYDVFALVAATMFVLCVAQEKSKVYRMFSVVNSFVWIVYDILAKAYGNLFTHSVLMLAALVAIMVRSKKEANKETVKS